MTDHLPSKERVEQAMFWAGVAGYGDLYVLALEVERLRKVLTGISTCSTCEACRGAAERALGDDVARINAAVDERLDRVERELAATYIEGTNGLGISGPWCSDCGTKQGYGHLVGCKHSGAAQPPGDVRPEEC